MEASPQTVELVYAADRSQVAGARPIWRRVLGTKIGVVAVVVLAALVASAIFAPLIAPFSPSELGTGDPLSGPRSGHLFGTDDLGRDLFSRVLYGGRLALGITAAATAVALVLGVVWGGAAAVASRWADEVLMRIVDVTLAIPFLLLALILIAAFGASVESLALVLGLVHTPWTARVARAAVLAELHQDYVLAARSYGTSARRLLGSEILPNLAPTLLAQTSVVAASVLLTEAALSFLGLGVTPPDASWGTLIQEGYSNINNASSQIVFPGVMVFAAVWSISVIADQVQAALSVHGGAGAGMGT